MNSFPSINEIVLICNRSSITMFLIFVPTGPVQLCFIVLTSFVNKSIPIQQKGTAFSRLYEVRYFRTQKEFEKKQALIFLFQICILFYFILLYSIHSAKNYITILKIWRVVMYPFPSSYKIVLICNSSGQTFLFIFVSTRPIQVQTMIGTSFVNVTIAIQQLGTAFLCLQEVCYFET